jgi:hypothetical protein
VPYIRTFSAMVPLSGFRASRIGSCAGLSAVPHPSHCFAASVTAELRGHGEYGWECQFLYDGELAYGRRWGTREAAVGGGGSETAGT